MFCLTVLRRHHHTDVIVRHLYVHYVICSKCYTFLMLYVPSVIRPLYYIFIILNVIFIQTICTIYRISRRNVSHVYFCLFLYI